MFVIKSTNRQSGSKDEEIVTTLSEVSVSHLWWTIETLSYPRHYVANSAANRRARDWLCQVLQQYGYTPRLQGIYDNIVVTTDDGTNGNYILLGAHYDTVPNTPGADDNASAVAVCLECARLLKQCPQTKVKIVFFNREEDNLLGSTDFVAAYLKQQEWSISEAHIFEMVGYCTQEPNSQRMPTGIPKLIAPTTGNFIGLLTNKRSNVIADELVNLAATYIRRTPVIGLKIYLGLEKYIADLHRSDHAPFWHANVPAIMWTDTSEFRNPHYHQMTDTIETLDFDFMADVTKLMLARIGCQSLEQQSYPLA